ncbi:MAG: hypothetical protein RLZZ123_2593 [Pseudomonadota bacterium]
MRMRSFSKFLTPNARFESISILVWNPSVISLDFDYSCWAPIMDPMTPFSSQWGCFYRIGLKRSILSSGSGLKNRGAVSGFQTAILVD